MLQSSTWSIALSDKQIEESSCSFKRGKHKCQWENIMRNFLKDAKNQVSCNYLQPLQQPAHPQPRAKTRFPIGSAYEGSWDTFGMSGHGTYTFPNGTVYEGEFHDGMFHGDGNLRYPSGITIRGKWRKGKLYEKAVVFPDDIDHGGKNWSYCRKPDRRFSVEHQTGLRPAGKSFLTAGQPTREIPKGYFDTGDGFYDCKTKNVYSAHLKKILRYPNYPEQKWIEHNCRYSEPVPVGPRKDLYEEWMNAKLKPSSRSDSVDEPNQTSNVCLESQSAKNSEETDIQGSIRFRPSDYQPDDNVDSSHDQKPWSLISRI